MIRRPPRSTLFPYTTLFRSRDLLSPAFRRGSFASGEVAQLAQLVGAQDERLAEFTRSATPGQLGTYNRSEEHTSELQSQANLLCRLLLEKKRHKPNPIVPTA